MADPVEASPKTSNENTREKPNTATQNRRNEEVSLVSIRINTEDITFGNIQWNSSIKISSNLPRRFIHTENNDDK